MIFLLKFVLAILITLAAILLAFAVLAPLPGDARRVGRRRQPRPIDPHLSRYADMPGFSPEQLEEIARRPVEQHHASDGELLRRSAAGSGKPSHPLGPLPLPANFNRRGRRAF